MPRSPVFSRSRRRLPALHSDEVTSRRRPRPSPRIHMTVEKTSDQGAGMARRRSTRLHPQIEEGAGMAPRRSPRLHSRVQASEDGDGFAVRRSPRLHPQIHAGEDGAGVTHGRRRPRPRSPVMKMPLDDEDLLAEILLRLPPLPSSLPRASAVCRHWRSLASDPGFCRRFRRHHRCNLPLLGFFDMFNELPLQPTLEAPNRVPLGRFSWQSDYGDSFWSFGCRHGLVLIYLSMLLQVLVWDPVTGDQHRIAVPPGFNVDHKTTISGAVLRAAAGDGHHFHVALVGNGDKQDTLAVVSVYSSETRVWSNLISAPLPPDDSVTDYPTMIDAIMDAVLVGDCLYWRLTGSASSILEFDLGRQSLAVIPVPVDLHADEMGNFRVMRADGGGLGFLFLSEFSVQLWKRNTSCDGVASWVLERTIELEKLLPHTPFKRGTLMIAGYAEDNNVALLWILDGLFTISLESSHVKEHSELNNLYHYHAFESVYTAENVIGGGHDGAGLLHNT